MLVLRPLAGLTLFETVISLLDRLVCVDAILLGKGEERNLEVAVAAGAEVEEAAGAELGPASAGLDKLLARDGIAVAARRVTMLRRMMMAVRNNAVLDVSSGRQSLLTV